MKKSYTLSQKIFFTFLLGFTSLALHAQVSSYIFSQSVTAYTPITGGTLLGNTTSDDQLFVDPAVPLGGTTLTGVGFPIGFNFTYNGLVFDRFAINTNGWIGLGSSGTTPSVDLSSTSNFNTPLSSVVVTNPPVNRNRIAAIGKDMEAQDVSSLRIETIGTTPNQVLVVQWQDYKRYSSGSGGNGDTLNYQILLYETSNVVQVHFGNVVFGAAVASALGAPHIGLGGTIATDFNNRTTTTDWNATFAGTANNQGCDVNTGVTYPVNGRAFTWTPPVICSGTPAAGVTESDINPVCDGQTFILSLNGASSDGGITYQWISSNDGINFAYVGGATNSTFSASQSVTTYNRCIVTCPASGLSDTSVVLQVTMKPANQCYCNSAAGNAADTKIDSVEFLTVLTGSPASTCETYTNYTSQVATVQQTVPFSLRIRNGSCSGVHYAAYVTVFIDYNQNGLFDGGELAYSFGPTTGLNTVTIANISIPITATIGQTGMRIILSEASLAGACDAYDYGETEDYMLNIAAAPVCLNPPLAGSILGATTVCPGNTVSLNISGHSVGTTLQWESSADNSSWSEISGATNASYTTPAITDTIYYRVKVKCTDSVYTAALEITLNAFLSCYCSEGILGFCGPNAEVNNVSISATTLNNTSGCSTTVNGDAYTAYPDTGAATTTLYQTVPYQLNVTTNELAITSVWIDYDQDGLFEASEWTHIDSSALNASVIVTVPLSALLGQTGMRIRSRLQGNQNGAGDACLDFGSGECEDYIITIAGPPACTDPPASGSINGDALACIGSNVALDLSGHTLGTSLQWETSSDGNSWADVAGAVNAFYTTPAITDTVYYRVKVTCVDSVYSAPFGITLIPFYDCYCPSEASETVDTKIDSVDFLTVATGSLNTTCETYTDYTSLVATVQKTVPFSLRIRNGSCSGDHYDAYVGVYIDYNQNGILDDAGESVYSFGPTTALNTIPMTNITVPANAQLGQTRMRVILSEGALSAPCDAYDYGETEDYLLDIAAAPACSNPTVGGTASGPATAAVGPNYLYEVTGSNGTIQWQFSTTSVSGPYTDITGATDDSVFVNFNGGATYWLRAYLTSPGCDPDSSNAVETVVGLAGDDVCDAVVLSFGTNGPFNTSSATIQTGEPAPPGIACQVQNGWCTDSTISNTLWFSFIAPASGRVRIQSPDFDTQLALWDASTCGDILTGGATLIAANDDDPNSASHGGVSFSSFIDSAVCLTPGRTYYVQLDPYSSPGGTTTIVLTDLGGLIVSVNTETDISCFGLNDGAIDMNVSGGSGSYTYEWSSGELTEDISGLSADIYSLTVTEAGCDASVASSAVIIDEPTAVVVTIDLVTDNACAGVSTGAVDISVSGGTPGYTFDWSNGDATEDITGLAGGSYDVTVADAEGCTATSSATVSNGPSISITIDLVTNSACAGLSTGAIDISVSGGTPGYTFDWSNGDATEDITGLAAGSYDVSVADAVGCTATSSATVGNNAGVSITIDLVTNSACAGLSTGAIDISASGGTPGYTFDWSNGDATEDITGLAAGSYDVSVEDAAGCTATSSATVGNGAGVSITIDLVTNSACAGLSTGAIDISASGGTPGYTFDWSNGDATEDITGLAAGSYDVSVEDAAGCTATSSATVGNEPGVSITIDLVTNSACAGVSTGAVDISVSGGTPGYTFDWSNGDATEDITGLAAGSYDVSVEDAVGCSATSSATVGNDPGITITLDLVTDNVCAGGTAGAVDISVSGGTGGYTFDWSNGDATEDITGLAAGSYDVSVEDAVGCSATSSATVGDGATITVIVDSVHHVSCNGLSDGDIYISVTGGTPASYLWCNGVTSEDNIGISAGSCGGTVTDINGCTASIPSVTITEPTTLVVTLDSVTNVACFGGSTGCVSITVSGGTPAYTFAWSNSSTTADICGLSAGAAGVTVTDANACSATISASITQPSAALSATSVATPQIQGGTLGSVNVTISGGTSPYVKLWSNGAVIEDLTNVAAGVYTCTITDANGCATTISDTVDFITGIGTVGNTFAVNLYPNPTQEKVFLELTLNEASNVTVDIYTISGQLVHQFAQRNILTTTFEMNFANEAAGVYYAKIKAGETTLTKRITLAK